MPKMNKLKIEVALDAVKMHRVVAGPAAQDVIIGTFFVSRTADDDEELASLRPEDEARLEHWKPGAVWSIEAD